MDADLDEGGHLVCKTTGSSWTPLFMLAAALVIPAPGGQMATAPSSPRARRDMRHQPRHGDTGHPDGRTIRWTARNGPVAIDAPPGHAAVAAGRARIIRRPRRAVDAHEIARAEHSGAVSPLR